MKKTTGLRRIINATGYSLQGLKTAFLKEPAFKQETFLLIVAIVVVFCIDFLAYERILLIGSIIFIMIAELINSAIECVVDRIGTEPHILSGRAKDYGSAVVFLMILLTITIWLYLFIVHFTSCNNLT